MRNRYGVILLFVDLVFFVTFVYFLIPVLAMVAPALVHFLLHPIHNIINYVDNFGYIHFKNVILPEFIIPLVLSLVVGFILFKLHKTVFEKENQSKIFLVFTWSFLLLFIATELFYFTDFYQDEEPAGGISKRMVIQITMTYVIVFLCSFVSAIYLYKKHKSILGK